MTTPLRSIAVIAVLLVALAGCGSDDASSGGAAAEPGPSATTEPGGSPTVTSVTYQRSGGKAGGTVRRTFAPGQPPPDGFSEQQVEQVVDHAQVVVDGGAAMPELPANTCCDRYVYTVVIELSDGSVETFSAVDGARYPAAFDELLSVLS
jgi:hypothetical protein